MSSQIPNFENSTGAIIDGVAASEAVDSSGEVLDVRGCDISSLEAGDGTLNYEHKSPEGGDSDGNEVVGRVVYAKKVLGEDDCETERQRSYWRKLELPFIYFIARLRDGAGHAGAKALAAHFRDDAANDEPQIFRFSIEGHTLSRDDNNRLTSTLARAVAITRKPCNKTALSGLILDPNAPEGFDKRPDDGMGAATKAQSPYGYVTEGQVALMNPLVPDPAVLGKALEGGQGCGAFDQQTQGAALQKEQWARRAAEAIEQDELGFTKAEWRRVAKHLLPDADEEFIDHWGDLADEVRLTRAAARSLRKAEPPALPAAAPGPLVVGGQPLLPNPQVPAPFFDAQGAALHTPLGSFRVTNPTEEEVAEALAQPSLSELVARATQVWVGLRDAVRQRKVGPDVLAAGTLWGSQDPAAEAQELLRPGSGAARRLQLWMALAQHHGPDAASASGELARKAGVGEVSARLAYGAAGGEGVGGWDDRVVGDLLGLGEQDGAAARYVGAALAGAALRGLEAHYTATSPYVRALRRHPELAGHFASDADALFPATLAHGAALALRDGPPPADPWQAGSEGGPVKAERLRQAWAARLGPVTASLLHLAYSVPRCQRNS